MIQQRLPRLMVCGYGRHGKDTFCELMEPLKFVSSSMFVADKAVFPFLSKQYGYTSVQECYDDRANHRAEWHHLIRNYNREDRAKLARELYEDYDIYCGIRWHEEFYAAQDEGLFDLAIWIDASARLPAEGKDSITVTKEMCDIVIENNRGLPAFMEKAVRFRNTLLGRRS